MNGVAAVADVLHCPVVSLARAEIAFGQEQQGMCISPIVVILSRFPGDEEGKGSDLISEECKVKLNIARRLPWTLNSLGMQRVPLNTPSLQPLSSFCTPVGEGKGELWRRN